MLSVFPSHKETRFSILRLTCAQSLWITVNDLSLFHLCLVSLDLGSRSLKEKYSEPNEPTIEISKSNTKSRRSVSQDFVVFNIIQFVPSARAKGSELGQDTDFTKSLAIAVASKKLTERYPLHTVSKTGFKEYCWSKVLVTYLITGNVPFFHILFAMSI